MPDNNHKHKTPIPKVIDVGTFHERFGTDEACLEHLKQLPLRSTVPCRFESMRVCNKPFTY